MAALSLGVLSLLWGSSWMAEQGMVGLGRPCALGAVRYSLAALMLALAAGALQRKSPPQPARWLWSNLLLGFTMLGAPYALVVWSGQHGSGGWAPLIYATLPLGLLLAGGQLRTAAIAAPGAMLLLLNGSLPLGSAHLAWTLPIVIAVTLQGWALWYAQQCLSATATPSGVAVQCAAAALMLAAASLVCESQPRLQPALGWSGEAATCMVLLSSLGVAVAYPLYYSLLRLISPAQAATCQWLQTVVAIAEGALVLGRSPTWTMGTAAAILIVCAWLMLRGEEPDVATLKLLRAS